MNTFPSSQTSRGATPVGDPAVRREPLSRWYWLTPLISMAIFIAVMGSGAWWLHRQQQSLEREVLFRDTETAAQTVRLRVLSQQDALSSLARSLAAEEIDENGFRTRARELVAQYGELNSVAAVDAQRNLRWAEVRPEVGGSGWQPGMPILESEPTLNYNRARDARQARYSRVYSRSDRKVFDVAVPVYIGARFSGMVIATYSMANLLSNAVPAEVRSKYKVEIHDREERAIAGEGDQFDELGLEYSLLLDPPGDGMRLVAHADAQRPHFRTNLLLWLVLGLSVFIIWSLASVWRHMLRRAAAEQQLEREAGFRRAMEDSMLTGMRAIDMEGRITYVNAAFCRMTGFAEHELLGAVPPYPYWTAEDIASKWDEFAAVMSSRAYRDNLGLEATVQRKDGSRFAARLYLSPLIDERGAQFGWMTSMTDITEPKRVRESLAAAHERFTTVLEELDAAVSVVAPPADPSLGEAELLFANRYFRQLFGNDPDGHAKLAGAAPPDAATPGAAHEVHCADIDRWFEVRRRQIEWVDGRRVEVQIATDITSRVMSENLQRQQHAREAWTSRLITMGEMASSLAHELNQPLTAIANYSMGTVARVKSIMARDPESRAGELLPPLEKTASQAQRAGAIIRRIREFVKRREPNRKKASVQAILDDAIGLVEFDAVKRQAVIETDLDADLPAIAVDPILIEQVLVNLMRNGIEAMADARERRLTVGAHVYTDANGVSGLAIDVMDRGHGIPAEAAAQLFEPFYTTKSEGMGMGLNICRSIVEFHQGRLWAENNPPLNGAPNGCTFHLRLPFHEAGESSAGTGNPEVTTTVTPS